MLIDDLSARLTNNLGHPPTPGQMRVIPALATYVLDQNDSIFLIKGYAGTGKTTLVASLVKTLADYRIKTVLLAPTGRAAKVMSTYSSSPAYTIHKRIYRQKKVIEGFGEFGLDRNLSRNTLFIVDEASMISNQTMDLSVFGSGRLLDDLISYVFSGAGCKLVLIGDDAQLPPVGFPDSNALNSSYLSRYGFPVSEYTLREVVRHTANSGILFNATKMREYLAVKHTGLPAIVADKFDDVVSISGQDLPGLIEQSYQDVGVEETMVVCRSNKQANRYNLGIRNMILQYEEEIRINDLVMVVKNNYHWLRDNPEVDFIANGDILEIMRIKNSRELYDLHFRDASVRLTDYRNMEFDAKLMLDTITMDTPALDRERLREFFNAVSEDYFTVKGKKHKADAIREDPFFNALQIKFAYAVTCHKAQGGQWKHVYIDQGFIQPDALDSDYYRWLYTAITRATEKLFLINFRSEFLDK